MKRYGVVYLLFTVVCLAILLSHFVSSQGAYERYFFWKDEADTGMDFVNCLAESAGGKPYSGYHSSYPPVAEACFYALQTMLPPEVKALIPRTHAALIRRRQTVFDLRTHQSVLLLLILYSVLSVMLMFCVAVYKFRSYGALPAMGMGLASVSSYGSICALERGNIVLLSIGLLMIFLFGYDSSDRHIRLISYAALILSSCIKLYPALFALMLFDHRRHSGSAVLLLCGMALSGSMLSAASFCLFDGFKDIPLFLKYLFGFNSGSGGDLYYRYGMRGIAGHFLDELYKKTGLAMPHPRMIVAAALALAVLSLSFALYTHMRCGDPAYQAAFDIAIFTVLIQSQSTDYTLCLFIPVMLMFIYEMPGIDLKSVSYFVLLSVFVLPYYTPTLSDTIDLTVHHVDIIQTALLVSVGYELVNALSELSSHSHHHGIWHPGHLIPAHLPG